MNPTQNKPTVILGATTNPSRYAFLAANSLMRHGHTVYLVGIKKGEVNGVEIQSDFPAAEIDTITLYLSAKWQNEWYDSILAAKPNRVIFNPGTENPELVELLRDNDIETVHACTLVMLQSRHF